jgi:photosystem II stability/assembly factor-like uncharacterized protein
MSPHRLYWFLLAALVTPPLAAQDTDPYAALRARAIGPAGMSGRVADVEVVLSDRNVIYVGGATGGLFRSTDAGLTWKPIFDEQDVLGIGAIEVFQANPDIVWVGTGEGNPRNSAGVGRGVFKSVDGGHSWESMGLRRSERIHRIVTHPTDADVVYVGAMGPAWSDGQERGLFRTRDGGRSWDRVLWQNQSTGIADLVMDPSNPNKLFAAMWDFRRSPGFFTSGGPGSGLFVTYDGGDSWTQLTEEDGLPAGELGRIGLAISPSSPNVVYALVEAAKSALLRSDDGGRSWKTISDAPGIAPRPFYYADLRIDPKNENRLYSLHSAVQVSEDQGRSWRTVVPSQTVHGDVHELWIDPDEPRRMILGEDGGIAFTYDRGEHWRFVENLPLAQFYHISVDDAVPFNIYGGLQDNGSWYGPSTVWENKGILNAHWRRVGGGDGFSVIPDPTNPSRFGYSMSQGGSLQHFDKLTGARTSIRPVHPDGTPLRFNWNAGLASDPLDPSTLYLGSQFLHRTRDQGRSWEIVSPDLTTNDPTQQRAGESGGLTTDASGAEMHTTIISVAPSPLERGLIWVGTDDGNVQLTRNGGDSWTNLRDRVPDLPEGIWIPDVDPSKHVAGRAYLVAEDHRRGDWTPRVYVTEDYGESWRSLASPEIGGFVHAIEEDPGSPNLLFLGTEFGLRVSFDRGNSWEPYTSGVPSVPIRDLVVHPRDADLVLGTHGRALLVIDDIRPLRALAADPSIRNAAVYAFGPPTAYDVGAAEAIGYRSTGHTMQQGEMRPRGALISYWVAEGGETEVEITDPEGELVYSKSVTATDGLNRLSWNLRPGGDADEALFPRQVAVLPGSYTVTVSIGDGLSTTQLEVAGDPRDPPSRADLIARRDALREMNRIVREATDARDELREVSEGVQTVLETLPDDADRLREGGESLAQALEALDRRFFTGPECQGMCGRDVLFGRVRQPLGRIAQEGGAPSANTRIMMDQARAAAETIVGEIDALMDGAVTEYREALRAAGYTPFGMREE